MIAPSEMMVGDWFQTTLPNGNVEYRKVIAVFGGYVDYYDGVTNAIEPIPITPEILEKNGFDGKYKCFAFLELDDKNYLEYYYHKHRLRKYCGDIDKWLNYEKVDITFQCQCFYVHELQHILKLCGIEKKIEL